MGLFSFLTQELAMDLGTANTVIIMKDKIVVDEPSIVAMDHAAEKAIAIGMKAQLMHGRLTKVYELYVRSGTALLRILRRRR